MKNRLTRPIQRAAKSVTPFAAADGLRWATP